MTLNQHLDDIHHDLTRGVFANEASVSQGIILRLLGALGWPKYDTQVIVPEYSVEGRRVDYALCHPPSKPLVFIEVKQVGQIEGAERQLFEYAFHTGVPIAVLTDGREWHFFQPGGQGDYRERRVCKLDLIETDNEEISGRLNRYLNYESIRTGEAITAIENDYRNISKQRQIERSLPEAWTKLVEDADEFLIDVVAKITESLCGHKPTSEQVLAFLKSLNRDRPTQGAPSPPTGSEDRPPPKKDPSPPTDSSGRKPSTNLIVTMPNRERIAHHSARKTFTEVIERLGIDRVRSVYPDLFSTSKLPYSHRVGQYYIKDVAGTRTRKRTLERIAARLGVELEIEIRLKGLN